MQVGVRVISVDSLPNDLLLSLLASTRQPKLHVAHRGDTDRVPMAGIS